MVWWLKHPLERIRWPHGDVLEWDFSRSDLLRKYLEWPLRHVIVRPCGPRVGPVGPVRPPKRAGLLVLQIRRYNL